MSVATLIFEAVMAGLMIVLILYCVRLNRRLSALRAQDDEILQLIGQLDDASARAEATVQALKSAGLSAERELRDAIADADRLARALNAPAEIAPGPIENDPGSERSRAEETVIEAIRRSRLEVA